MEGPVRCGVSNIQEERLSFPVITDKTNSRITNRIGIIERLLRFYYLITYCQPVRCKETSTPGYGPEKTIESSLQWPIMLVRTSRLVIIARQMPFSTHISSIPGSF